MSGTEGASGFFKARGAKTCKKTRSKSPILTERSQSLFSKDHIDVSRFFSFKKILRTDFFENRP